jgi:hypothetical protein
VPIVRNGYKAVNYLKLILECYKSEIHPYEAEITLCIVSMITEMLLSLRSSVDNSENTFITKAIDYIEKNFDKNISPMILLAK